MDRIIKTKRECPCCKGNKAEVLTTTDFLREDSVLPKHYDIVCCMRCGMSFADSNGTQEHYNQYYEKFNNYTYDAQIKIQSLEGTDYKAIYEYIIDHYDKSVKIIDVGCGGGILLQCLHEVGYDNIMGLDPCENSIRQLQKRNIAGRVGNIFADIHEEDLEAFDLILSTGVMEHIFDVDTYIKKLMQYMKDETSAILVAVPSAEGFPKRMPPKPHCFNHEHINYFSIHTLDNTMRNHGLCRINDEYTILDKGGWVIYGVYQRSKVKECIEKDTVSKDSILEYLTVWDRQVVDIENKINRIVKEQRTIIVFGVGCFLEWLLICYPEVRRQIVFCVDNNPSKQGKAFSSLEVFSSDKIKENEDATVLVCSMLYSSDIVKQLQSMNVSNPVIVL